MLIQSTRTAIVCQTLSDASINRKLSAVKSLLSFACELRVLSLNIGAVFRMVRRAGKRVGLEPNISPHWLRHAHASHALDRGAPLPTTHYLHARHSDSSSFYLME